jgi:hypothetical protein
LKAIFNSIDNCPRRRKSWEAGEDCIVKSFITCIIRVMKSRRMRCGAVCSTHGRDEKYIRNILVGKPEGEIRLGIPRRTWEDSIRMYRGEIGWKGAKWMHLAKDRDQWRAVLNSVMNLWVP